MEASVLMSPTSDDWIVTAAGHELDLRRPAPGMLDAGTMAHSLAQLNRFTGHATRPYSVAEHSLLVVEILQRELGITPATLGGAMTLLLGLMHDAHEALTGDLHTPGKRMVGPAWREFEGRLEHAVRRAYALVTVAAQRGELVKRADLIALATERRDLLPATATPWLCLHGIEPITWLRLDTPERQRMSWTDWRDVWLEKLLELDYARNSLAGMGAAA